MNRNTVIMALITAILSLPLSARGGDLKSLKIGDSVPTFSLKNHDGATIELAKIAKGASCTVILFIATECPVSNAYNERMAALAGSYAGKKVAFVGVNSNKAESVERIAEHAKENAFTFPVVKDSANIIADKYGAQVTPEVFVVDSAFTLLYHGRIDDDRKGKNITSHDLKNALDALLAGKNVPVSETKAFGCTIKRVGS